MRKRETGAKMQQHDRLGTYTLVAPTRNVVYPITSPNYYSDYIVCFDEVHPDHPKSGGPFSLSHYSVDHSDANLITGYTNYGYGKIFSGARRCVPNSYMTYPEDSLESCSNLGPSAWDRFKPKLSKVGLGQFIAELRDAPSLLRMRLKRFKDLGSDYLNVQFGWKPFLSDLRRWYASLLKLDQQLDALQKRNGKWIRRGGTLYEESDTSVDSACSLTFSDFCLVDGLKRTVHSHEKAWFVGSFRYYIPGLTDGSWGKLRKARKLWGLEVTPSLCWELLPWSWLADWFSNVGSVISNYDSITFDHMAAKYAYVMLQRTTTINCEAHVTGRLILDRKEVRTSKTAKTTIEYGTKARSEASPFGFGLELGTFSSFQISILAALGISRLR